MGLLSRVLLGPGRARVGRGYHATWKDDAGSWINRGERPNINYGEGFGFHYGSRPAAEQRVPDAKERSMAWVRHRPKGRTVHLPDLENWDRPDRWLDNDLLAKSEGLSLQEQAELLGIAQKHVQNTQKMKRGDPDALLPSEMPRFSSEMRKKLLDKGVSTVRYNNEFEDKGVASYIALNPDELTIRPYRPALEALKRAAAVGGGFGLLGAGAYYGANR